MREAIYKGATRPAMKWGIPLVVLVGVFMPAIVVATWAATFGSLWVAIATAALLAPLFLWMRLTTHRDDQRLLQMLLWFRLQHLNPNRNLWGARSYGAHRRRGACNAWR